ncbi:hypothetical protein EEL31_19955 [Brevibacillus laterosporus]|nr:hypothetical protein [Brevibacillus laterosporus]TPG70525.1 hypothetical protein EEL31_19955 [Brevibacillus laterosporus]
MLYCKYLFKIVCIFRPNSLSMATNVEQKTINQIKKLTKTTPLYAKIKTLSIGDGLQSSTPNMNIEQ